MDRRSTLQFDLFVLDFTVLSKSENGDCIDTFILRIIIQGSKLDLKL